MSDSELTQLRHLVEHIDDAYTVSEVTVVCTECGETVATTETLGLWLESFLFHETLFHSARTDHMTFDVNVDVSTVVENIDITVTVGETDD